MNNQPDNQNQSDDQALAKVLAGVSQAADDNLKFEETNSKDDKSKPPVGPSMPTVDPAAAADPAPTVPAMPQPSQPSPMPDPIKATDPVKPAAAAPTDPALTSIKDAALSELRPLIDKLDVAPEEKFDTYLLLLRSTDDKALIAPAHEAAKAITDESRKAQALLDIIKEIDFLSNQKAA
ncbi:hypothetical protein CR969_00565 [Candidatus Saccharibacteria bacterium]|nr:MAG: hypothetical protein CR969_00565 [Candidatus Saccharibacteria bacterium]